MLCINKIKRDNTPTFFKKGNHGITKADRGITLVADAKA